MSEMIYNQRVVARRFELAPDFTDGDLPPVGTGISWSAWQRLDAAGKNVDGMGVILDGDDDISALQDKLDRVAFVAVHFPKFTDGRCYSHARRIRALWGYKGDILAFGDVLRDQLIYMARSGANAFYMREDQNLRASLASFSLFTEFYQYDWGHPQA